MRPRWVALSIAALASALMAAPTAAAADPVPSPDPDPWFGPDKALHFGATFALSAGGYGIGVAVFEERWAGLVLGAGVALGLGALKEGLDAAGLGHPSGKDFLWDVVGTALGLGVALTFDAALRGPDAR
jgi:putative lipoprotein